MVASPHTFGTDLGYRSDVRSSNANIEVRSTLKLIWLIDSVAKDEERFVKIGPTSRKSDAMSKRLVAALAAVCAWMAASASLQAEDTRPYGDAIAIENYGIIVIGEQKELPVVIACNNPEFVREIIRADVDNDIARANERFEHYVEWERCFGVYGSVPIASIRVLPLYMESPDTPCAVVENRKHEAVVYCILEAEVSTPTFTPVDSLFLNPPNTFYVAVMVKMARSI